MALNYTQLTAITQDYFLPKVIDNIFNSNALLQRARSKKWYTTNYDGGLQIIQPVAYAVTSSSGWFTGAGVLDTSDNDQITAAAFTPAHAYANITITRDDELRNSGKAQVANLIKSKVQIAEKTLADTIGTGLYNDGTTTNAMTGLRLAVDSAGTYGGIDRSAYTWWAAQEDGVTAVTSIAKMQAMFGDCSIGSDKPTVITSTQDLYDAYYALLQPQQRFMDSETAKGGFTNLMFNSVPIVVDSHCPANHMFFLNEDYIELVVHKDENFRFEPFQKVINQAVQAAKIYWYGNLVVSNCRMQGKMNALTA